ncbi:MAG: hypothetical protein WBB07_17400 [Mycobacterium sp.]
MSTWIIAAYVAVAITAFVVTIRVNREVLRGAMDDDPIGASFFTLSIGVLAAAWPVTVAMLGAIGLTYLAIRATLAVITR